jgi:hypothetical protein
MRSPRNTVSFKSPAGTLITSNGDCAHAHSPHTGAESRRVIVCCRRRRRRRCRVVHDQRDGRPTPRHCRHRPHAAPRQQRRLSLVWRVVASLPTYSAQSDSEQTTEKQCRRAHAHNRQHAHQSTHKHSNTTPKTTRISPLSCKRSSAKRRLRATFHRRSASVPTFHSGDLDKRRRRTARSAAKLRPRNATSECLT